MGLAVGAEGFKITVADIPTVDGIVARCRNEPAFAGAKASNQSDYPG